MMLRQKRHVQRLVIVPPVVLFVLALAATGRGQDGPPPKRPGYDGTLRQEEDWSVLGRPGEMPSTDLFDPIKHLPLNDDGSIWSSFGGSYSLRVEAWNNFAFDEGNDDAFVLSRLRLHGDIHLGEQVRVFAELKSALATHRGLPGGKRTLDVDELALQQLFVDIKVPLGELGSLTIRPGRQMLRFGTQRIVSPLVWANTMRTWDGVSAIWKGDDWEAQGFWTQFVPVEKYDFNDPDSQTEFWGVYVTGKVPSTEMGLDLYYLGLDRDDRITFNGTTGEEDRHTFGARLFGAVGRTAFDLDLEGAYQTGEVGAGDVDAFMLSAEAGYTFHDAPAIPRLWVGFDYASGDDSPGGDVETFNQLFPFGHYFLGYVDAVGRQNSVAFSSGVTIKPLEKWAVNLDAHLFFRADEDDALYNAGGVPIRAGGLDDAHEIGAELDLTVNYRFDRHLSVLLGYNHFFVGDFVDDSGPGDDVDFAFAWFRYLF